GLVAYAWAGFGAAFGPVVLISVLWKRMTRNGALAGMLVGAITVVVWKNFIGLGLYEIIPGFILASLTIWVVSLMGKEPSADIQQCFDADEKAYQDAHVCSAVAGSARSADRPPDQFNTTPSVAGRPAPARPAHPARPSR